MQAKAEYSLDCLLTDRQRSPVGAVQLRLFFVLVAERWRRLADPIEGAGRTCQSGPQKVAEMEGWLLVQY